MKKDFQIYLTKIGLSPQSTYGYYNKLKQFLNWCEQAKTNPETASIEDLYSYKNHCIDRGLSYHTTAQLLGVLKHYYQFIERIDNPALLIKHKKQVRSLPSNLLSEEELKELYHNINAKSFADRRNKVMLGMVIFQGMKREELRQIEIPHINLDKATIYISANRRTYARTLELHPMQMNHLMSYLYEFRPKLLTESHKKTERLFFSLGKGSCITNALYRMTKELQRSYPIFKNVTQIKESRMAIWVKEHGVRKAQYLSGIKYASSMLRYKTTDIEKLKQKLEIVHPMEGIVKG